MISGTIKFTAIAVGEFTVNLLGTTVQMKAKAAFVDTSTGTTHGWTEGNQWSPNTMLKMRELVALMEGDLAKQHFSGEAQGPAEGAVTSGKPGIGGGLGEHIGGDGDQL